MNFRRNKSAFLHGLIIVAATWIHRYTPENKIQPKQRIANGESAPKTAKTVSFVRKTMTNFFRQSWNHICKISWRKKRP